MRDDPFGWVGHTVADKFRVDACVAEGGFGIVYRALHVGFGAPVALKCLKLPARLQGAERERFLEAFLAEGRLLHQPGDLSFGLRAYSLDRGSHEVARGAHDRLRARRDRRAGDAGGRHGADDGARDRVTERLQSGDVDLGRPPELVGARRAPAQPFVRAEDSRREVERVTEEVDVVYLERRGGRIAVEIGHRDPQGGGEPPAPWYRATAPSHRPCVCRLPPVLSACYVPWVCAICVELEKGRMTAREARRALGEMVPEVGARHAEEIERTLREAEAAAAAAGTPKP